MAKGRGVHCSFVCPIGFQIYEGAMAARQDGAEVMVIGDAADYVFYGMDGQLPRIGRSTSFTNE